MKRRVPLVSYLLGVRTVVGEATVDEHGKVEGVINDAVTADKIRGGLGAVSIGFGQSQTSMPPNHYRAALGMSPFPRRALAQCSSCGVDDCTNAPYNQSCACCFNNHIFGK